MGGMWTTINEFDIGTKVKENAHKFARIHEIKYDDVCRMHSDDYTCMTFALEQNIVCKNTKERRLLFFRIDASDAVFVRRYEKRTNKQDKWLCWHREWDSVNMEIYDRCRFTKLMEWMING